MALSGSSNSRTRPGPDGVFTPAPQSFISILHMLNRCSTLRRSLLGLAALPLLFSGSSCAFMAHAISTGATYPVAIAELQPPAAGSGRVVIYTDAKLAEAISVDRDVYTFRGRTFFSVDLPVGEYLLSSSGISLTWGNPGLGESRLTLKVAEGETAFIAIREGGALREVERSRAETELAQLPLCKGAGVVDTISDEKWNEGA